MPGELTIEGRPVIPLTWPRYLIGRGEGADILLPEDDAGASRRHALIEETVTGDWTILDLGSSNGVYVNGARVTDRHTLATGDVVAVGRTQIRVSLPEPAPAVSATEPAPPSRLTPTAEIPQPPSYSAQVQADAAVTSGYSEPPKSADAAPRVELRPVEPPSPEVGARQPINAPSSYVPPPLPASFAPQTPPRETAVESDNSRASFIVGVISLCFGALAAAWSFIGGACCGWAGWGYGFIGLVLAIVSLSLKRSPIGWWALGLSIFAFIWVIMAPAIIAGGAAHAL